MQLYVVRHGTTDNNVKRLVNGRNDNDINKEGIKDSKIAKMILSDVDFDRIYCSPLLRAKHTMEIINDNRYPVTYDERLAERDAGVMTNRSEDDIDFTLWNRIDVGVIYGGSESFTDLIKRVGNFLAEIKERHKEDTILLVTHAGVMKSIEVYLYGYPGIEEIMKWDYQNGEVKHYYL